MKKLKQLWSDFSKLSFPKEVHSLELDLELIDSTMAGCISSFLNYGVLESEKKKVLKESINTLNSSIDKVPKTGQIYFEKLLKIGKLTLSQCK